MPDILIREVSEKVREALSDKARAEGVTREDWLRAQLIKLAAQPTIKSRYAFKAYGPEGAFATIKRHPSGLVQRGADHCSAAQFDAFQMAVNYVERNDIGDRELAHDLLSKHFETVFETNQ